MTFTNDVVWQITFWSLHEDPPLEDSIQMHWSNDMPRMDDMIEAIIIQRPELAPFRHHIRVQSYHRLDPTLITI